MNMKIITLESRKNNCNLTTEFALFIFNRRIKKWVMTNELIMFRKYPLWFILLRTLFK